MRWFKHMSASQNDEKMSELLDRFGAEGYGAWWLILERIAQQMDKSSRTSARLSVKVWAKSCRISAKNFQKLATFLEKIGTFFLKLEGDYLTIDCPNLAKYRDEWSSRKENESSKTRELLGSNSGVTREQDTDTEADTEAEAETHTDKKHQKATSPSAPEIFEIFEFWKLTTGHEKAVLDEKRKSKIKKALDLGYSFDQLKKTIEGYANSQWHRENKQDELTLMLRDSAHIERFLGREESHKSHVLKDLGYSDPMGGI